MIHTVNFIFMYISIYKYRFKTLSKAERNRNLDSITFSYITLIFLKINNNNFKNTISIKFIKTATSSNELVSLQSSTNYLTGKNK